MADLVKISSFQIPGRISKTCCSSNQQDGYALMPLSRQACSPAKPSFHFPPWLSEGDTETTVQMTNFGTPASPHCQYNHLHSGKFCWVSHHRAECYLNAKRGDRGVINSASWGAPVDSNILSSPRPYSLNALLWHNMSEQACYNFLCLWITVVFGGRAQKKKKSMRRFAH